MSVIDEEKLLQAAKEASSGVGELDSIIRVLDKIMELINHPLVGMLIEGFMRPRGAPAQRPVDPLQAVLQGPDDPEMFKRYLNNIITVGPGGVVGGGGGPGPMPIQAPPAAPGGHAPPGVVEAPLNEDIDLEGNEAPPVGAEPPSNSAKAKLIALISRLSEEDAKEILAKLGEGDEEYQREDTGDTDSNT